MRDICLGNLGIGEMPILVDNQDVYFILGRSRSIGIITHRLDIDHYTD